MTLVPILAGRAAGGVWHTLQTGRGNRLAAVQAIIAACVGGHLLADRGNGGLGEQVSLVLRKIEFVSEAFHLSGPRLN
jgi:hypothetical protein